MMEIKYRAWDKTDKKMVSWNEIKNYYNLLVMLDPVARDYERFIVMQFTGLTDINGVEIYEGDIVKETTKLKQGKKVENFYEITFDNGMFKYKQPLAYGHHLLEVIGNIKENKDLIE